jgi:exodeoxyribonuclease VII large subunit
LHRAHPHRRIAEQRHALAAMRHRLETAVQPAMVRRRHAIEAACGKLEALSPMRVLERGFSLTQRADGHVVTSASDVQPGDRLTVRVSDGGIDATVEGTHKK